METPPPLTLLVSAQRPVVGAGPGLRCTVSRASVVL